MKSSGKSSGKPSGIKVLIRNRRASHDYTLHDRFEAGLVLLGSEVKSLRDSRGRIADAYVELRDGEAWLINAQIDEYPWANIHNHEPLRKRKLLLNRNEIKKLDTKTNQRGQTIVPLQLYLKNGKIKIEIALATGKREFEKRQSKQDLEAKREMARAIKLR